MSYGFFTKQVGYAYDGRSTSTDELGNGVFIEISETAQGPSAKKCGAVPERIPYLVSNVDESQPEEGISTVDLTVKPGKYLRAKQPITGELFCTSESEAVLNVGDNCFASGGKLKKLTTETPIQTYVVTDVDTIDDKTIYYCRVI